MALGEVLTAMEVLGGPGEGEEVAALWREEGLEVEVAPMAGERGRTTFLRTRVAGERGRRSGGEAPTIGIVGRLGGVGVRPHRVGLVSDGDGAVAAVAAALRLARMARRGDRLPGDVTIATHVCPAAPTEPHDPVPFMGTPVPMRVMNEMEVGPEMEAVLVVDASKGNRILNHRGIAFTATVLRGWVLPVAPDLVTVYEQVCGIPARVLPISTYDITPYGNGLFHVNSILQPAVATAAPVVGVATTAEVAVPGSATGASRPEDVALAVEFCLEVAQRFGAGTLRLYDPEEFATATRRYGSLRHLQTMGRDEGT